MDKIVPLKQWGTSSLGYYTLWEYFFCEYLALLGSTTRNFFEPYDPFEAWSLVLTSSIPSTVPDPTWICSFWMVSIIFCLPRPVVFSEGFDEKTVKRRIIHPSRLEVDSCQQVVSQKRDQSGSPTHLPALHGAKKKLSGDHLLVVFFGCRIG